MQNAGFNTGAVEPFILNFDDNPPLPHEDPNGGGVDPNSFGGNSYRFGTGTIGYAWIDDPFPSLPYGPQQWAQQISASDNIDSGAFIILKNHDVSRWDRLSFWIKGDVGTEEYSVGLKGNVADRLGNPLETVEVKLPIAEYHPDGAIASQWREVTIPLRDFADKGARLTALDNISFTNTKVDGGIIYIDDIAFLGDEFKPSAPQGLLETISGNSITLSWDPNPEPDVVGYRIYRSDDQGATFNLLNTRLIVPTVYADANPPGRQHLYRVTAVDNAQPANESGPSDIISVFINSAPILNPIGSKSADEAKLLQFQVYATDADQDPLVYSTGTLPQGAKFANQVFSWVPTYEQAGTYEVAFLVSDGYSTDSETITITVDNVNRPPLVGAIVPSSGSSRVNNAATFTATYSDADGWQDIQYVNLLINTSINLSKCFYGYYDQNTNKLYMRNDANTAWLGGYAPGSGNVIENSYAKINCASTTISGAGDTLTVNWNIVFKSKFTGSKKMYLYVKDDQGAYNGWVLEGTRSIKR